MKVKTLIEHLEDFDPEMEIFFYELGGFYDTVFLGISERNDRVEITIKNVEKTDEDIKH